MFLVFGVGLLVWRTHHGRPVRPLWRDVPAPPWLRSALVLWVFGVGLAVSVMFSAISLSRYLDAKRAARSGRLIEIAGPVEAFQQEVDRVQPEQFRVAGVTFRYSSSAYTPGFHHTRARGGPIAPGLLVRIGYASIGGEPTILTLDVCR